METTDRQANLNASASALMWLWGFLALLSAAALGFPALAMHGSVMPMALFGSWGVLHSAAALALRKRRWGGRWWASGLCVLSVVALLLMPRMMISLLGAAINAGALLLILFSWRVGEAASHPAMAAPAASCDSDTAQAQ